MKTPREQLLSCKLKRVRVKLLEFGLDLYVQEMNAAQREEYYTILINAVTDKKQKEDIAARVLLPSLLDLDGNVLLTENDLNGLADLSPQLIAKLTNSLLEVSGLLPEFYQAEKKRLKSEKSMSSTSIWLRNLRKIFPT